MINWPKINTEGMHREGKNKVIGACIVNGASAGSFTSLYYKTYAEALPRIKRGKEFFNGNK